MHGHIDYLQLPALDIERSAAFYERVFGWSIDRSTGSFEAPGLIGQLTTDIAPTSTAGRGTCSSPRGRKSLATDPALTATGWRSTALRQ